MREISTGTTWVFQTETQETMNKYTYIEATYEVSQILGNMRSSELVPNISTRTFHLYHPLV